MSLVLSRGNGARVAGFCPSCSALAGRAAHLEAVGRAGIRRSRSPDITMVIRPPLPKDADAISSLSSQLGYPVPPDEAATLQASLLQLPDHLVLIAEDEGGQVRGWIHVFISRRLFVPPFAELGGIVVDNTHRRSGIASELLAMAEEWALEAGCAVFRIRTNTRRVDAEPFYRSVGYELSKTQSVFQKALPSELNRSGT